MIPLIDGDIEYRDGGLYWSTSKLGRTVGRRCGSVNGEGYRHFTYNYQIYLEHRVIWEMFHGPIPDGYMIDHIDRDRKNNNLNNLRLVTHKGNQENRRAKGYSWDSQKGKWKARIVHHKKLIHIGHYDTEEEAHQAYLDKKRKLHLSFSEKGGTECSH